MAGPVDRGERACGVHGVTGTRRQGVDRAPVEHRYEAGVDRSGAGLVSEDVVPGHGGARRAVPGRRRPGRTRLGERACHYHLAVDHRGGVHRGKGAVGPEPLRVAGGTAGEHVRRPADRRGRHQVRQRSRLGRKSRRHVRGCCPRAAQGGRRDHPGDGHGGGACRQHAGQTCAHLCSFMSSFAPIRTSRTVDAPAGLPMTPTPGGPVSARWLVVRVRRETRFRKV